VAWRESVKRVPKPSQVGDAYGTCDEAWIWGPVDNVNWFGGYAFNGWFYSDNPAGPASYSFGKEMGVQRAVETPVFGDGMWVDAWPQETDPPARNLYEGWVGKVEWVAIVWPVTEVSELRRGMCPLATHCLALSTSASRTDTPDHGDSRNSGTLPGTRTTSRRPRGRTKAEQRTSTNEWGQTNSSWRFVCPHSFVKPVQGSKARMVSADFLLHDFMQCAGPGRCRRRARRRWANRCCCRPSISYYAAQ